MTYIRRRTCRHFTGLQHDACEIGIPYANVRQADKPYPERWPCNSATGVAVCPHWQARTDAEIAADDAEIAVIIRGLNAFASGETHACPTCGKEVTGARLYEKSEPETFSLYCLPCNCRQGLWSKVPAWITNVEIMPFEGCE